MTLLRFNDGIDEILTSSWTARPRKNGTEIAFLWGANSISWFDSATSVYRCTLAVGFDDFLRLVAQGRPCVDLTRYKTL